MKLSKIRQIIKEELEVILTNEEVGDFFGEDIQRKLEEDEAAEIEAADTDPEEEDKATAAVTASEEGGSQPYKITAESNAADAAEELTSEPVAPDIDQVTQSLEDLLFGEEGEGLSAETINVLETIYNYILKGKMGVDEPEEGRLPRVTDKSIAALKRRTGIGQGSPRGAASRHKTSQFDR